MKKQLPTLLIYFRLALAFVVLFGAFQNWSPWLLASITMFGFIADILDGILARMFGCSAEHLRLLDSIVDRIYWAVIAWAAYVVTPEYSASVLLWLVPVLILDQLVYVISLLRFRKIPSPHNLLTKLWGITIAIMFTEILLSESSFLFPAMIAIGFVSRIDSLLIYTILPKWDAPKTSMRRPMLEKRPRQPRAGRGRRGATCP